MCQINALKRKTDNTWDINIAHHLCSHIYTFPRTHIHSFTVYYSYCYSIISVNQFVFLIYTFTTHILFYTKLFLVGSTKHLMACLFLGKWLRFILLSPQPQQSFVNPPCTYAGAMSDPCIMIAPQLCQKQLWSDKMLSASVGSWKQGSGGCHSKGVTLLEDGTEGSEKVGQ